VFTPMLATATFNRDKLGSATREGFLNATDLADFLVTRGVPFREAHEVAGRAVRYAIEKGKTLEELTEEEYRQWTAADLAGLKEAVGMEVCLSRRQVPGGPAPDAVRQAILEAKNYLKINN